MIRDGDVLVAQRARRFGHFFERGAAVGGGGVHVEVAANVALLHQLRQRMRLGQFDFAVVLAQLGRNPVEAQRAVDLFFGFARDAHVVFGAEQPVLAQLEAHADGALPQRDVVLFAAGEILHGRAEARVFERAHIHLQAFAAELDAGLVDTAPQHFMHLADAPPRDRAPPRRWGR